MDYKIMIDAFEGPMDLLLHLIDRAEIDIYDIPIREIAEQFVEYIRKMEELNLDVASEFLVMAASLLEIKSKMLLPQKEKDNEDQLEIEEDPRAELIRRLVEYKKYKGLADRLKTLGDVQSRVYYRPKEDLSEYVDEQIILEGFDLYSLYETFGKILKRKNLEPNFLDMAEIEREEYTLGGCIQDIKERLYTGDRISFSELISNSSIGEIITYFLSILELIDMKYINVLQESDFGDLIIVRRLEGEQ
ncbi:MAG: segregation/condensation protein A [Tissierellaceae bacterium]